MFLNKKIDGRLAFFLIFFAFFFTAVLLVSQWESPRLAIRSLSVDIGFMKDKGEFTVYYDRVSYVYHHSLPFRFNRIEYPLLGVLYLSVPAVFTHNLFNFTNVLIWQNIIFGLILVYLTYQLLKAMDLKPSRLWILVLPSFVYCLLNRFDIFPVVLTQLAFLLLFRKKFSLAFFVLSLGFLAKGYTMVLFPVFFVYWLNQTGTKSLNLLTNKPLRLFALPVIVSIAVVCLWAGWENGLFPYYFQSTRFFSYGTFYVIYLKPLIDFMPLGLWRAGAQVALKIAFFLQILMPIMFYTGYQVFRRLVQDFRQTLLWSTVALLLYVFFSPYYSPQWILWFLPLLLLLAKSKKEFLLIVAYDLVNYLYYPLAWGAVGTSSMPFAMITLVRTILLVVIIYLLVKKGIAATSVKTPEKNITPCSAYAHD